jgi:starch phosphorylase
VVSLGTLAPDDVEVQLIHGPAGQGDELSSPTIVPMAAVGPAEDHHVRYAGTFRCATAGRYGVTVRIVPAHNDLVVPVELGKIAWA